MRTEAQERAMTKQNHQRAAMPKICPYPLSEEENELLTAMAAIYGNKRAALMAGLQMLKDYHDAKP